MRTWLITVGEPLPPFEPLARPWRTALLARELVARGHRVTWWTSSFNHATKHHYPQRDGSLDHDGIHYELLDGIHYPGNVSFRRLVNHWQLAREFERRSADASHPDVMVCSYPTIELAGTAVRLARRIGCPVLLDVRDLWPDLLRDVAPPPLRPLARVALHGYFRLAREALQGAHGIVAVSGGYLDWALRRAGREQRDADAVFLLGYSRPDANVDAAPAIAALRTAGVDPAKRICWFVGSFGRSVDLATVASAAAVLQQDGRDDLQIVISGGGEGEADLRDATRGLHNVVLTGWIDGVRIAALGGMASIGLQPYRAGAAQGLANKLFEYLSFGLPIMSSLGGENGAFLAAAGCGAMYPAGDARALARELAQLAAEPARLADMRARAAATFAALCDATSIYPSYADHVEAVAARGG